MVTEQNLDHKALAYRAEVSWDLKILINHSNTISDKQELEKKTGNLILVKNMLRVKTATF